MPTDSSDYLESIHSYHQQFSEAFQGAFATFLDAEFSNVSDIIIAGMGGSSFAGIALETSFLKEKLLSPLRVIREYDLPEYADENTLVIVTSYSGNTEEAISCYKEARDRGCKTLVISSGGELENLAAKDNIAGYIFDTKDNPSGAPRTSIGYILGSTLGLLSKLELIDYAKSDARETVKYMRSFNDLVKKDDRMPRQISQKLVGRIPIFVSAEHLTSATHIWRNFMNETAKHIAFAYELPAFNHHFLDGLLYPTDLKEKLLFVYINSDIYGKQNKKRMKITRDITKKHGIADISLSLGAKEQFNEFWELVVIGSLVSFHLAKIHGVNPSTNEMVDLLKSRL